MSYDSRVDTYEHVAKVRGYMLAMVASLIQRAHGHDASKLVSPEVEVFDEYTPKLRDSTYGSDEYEGFREAMGEGLRHHYAVNDHHPEHFDDGVRDMNLLQVIEMLCDWKAATERHADGDLDESIRLNAKRFGYGPELTRLLTNTAKSFGWIV